MGQSPNPVEAETAVECPVLARREVSPASQTVVVLLLVPQRMQNVKLLGVPCRKARLDWHAQWTVVRPDACLSWVLR
jgi:hypothetical protein